MSTETTSPVVASKIAGLSALKGLLVYAAVFAFAAVYIYFIVRISSATNAPTFDSTLITASSLLAGVLGSAFALYVGTATSPSSTNGDLGKRMAIRAQSEPSHAHQRPTGFLWLQRALSLEPPSTDAASWPLTAGLWIYAGVAAAVSVTYLLNQQQTPASLKAIAVAFGGYVLALLTAAYGIKPSAG